MPGDSDGFRQQDEWRNAWNSESLQEAQKFFEWAQNYERRGLKIAADAMRDEGRKAVNRLLSGYRPA